MFEKSNKGAMNMSSHWLARKATNLLLKEAWLPNKHHEGGAVDCIVGAELAW